MRTYFTQNCPLCGTMNILDNGDIEDQTVDDVGQFTCWNCRKEICLYSGEFHDVLDPHECGTKPEDDEQTGHCEGLKELKA